MRIKLLPTLTLVAIGLAILALALLAIPADARQRGGAWNGSAAPPSFTFVQQNTNSTFSGTTLTVALTGVVAGHDLRTAVIIDQVTATVTATSTGGSCSTITSSPSGGSKIAWIFACPNTSSGSVTVTATSTVATGAEFMLVEEWSGDSASPVDNGSGLYTNGAGAASSGNFTTTTNNDDIWCVIFQAQSVVPAVGSGFTLVSNGLQGNFIFSEHKVLATAGTTAGTWTTATGSFDNWVVAAGFK